jgi:hypothetical protein
MINTLLTEARINVAQATRKRRLSIQDFSNTFNHTDAITGLYEEQIMAAPAVTGPLLKLNNGVEMPALGFGTFANEGSKGETHKAVVHALNAGYRHLDCAWFYQNEEEVGSGIRDFLSQNPVVKRADIFITTKVWNHLHEPVDVEWSLKDSLKKLQTPYVDAFLIHWPIASEKNADRTVKIGSDGKVSKPSVPLIQS